MMFKKQKDRKKRIEKLADKCANGKALTKEEKELFKEIFGWLPR